MLEVGDDAEPPASRSKRGQRVSRNPKHRAVSGEGKAKLFVPPDLTERQHGRLGHLTEGLFKLPAGCSKESANSLKERNESCGMIDGFEAPIVAAQVPYGSLCAQHPHLSQLEKTEFPAACELELSATCFISIVLFHLKGFRIALPPNAHDRFMHCLLIWWGLLRAMYRQQQTKQFTPVEVTVEHLNNAMQLLSLEVLPFMPQPLIWSTFFHYITDPMWLIFKMRTYQTGAAPYGDGMSKVWRISSIEEARENVTRANWTPL